MAMTSDELKAIAKTMAEEMVAQVRGITGTLPDEWKGRANTLAEKSVSLAGRYARGEINKAELLDLADDLKIWARNEFAGAMLDSWNKRKAIVNAVVPILIKTLVSIIVPV